MSNAKPIDGSRKSIFNAHLLQLNNKALKFYLDGYDTCEFYALTKIIEAYGGRLTIPDKETIIFAESDRPVQKYYYRYNIKFIYDCMVANKMQNINNYLLPTTSHHPIKTESSCSEPLKIRQKKLELIHQEIDLSRKNQEKLPIKNLKTLQNNSTLILSSNEASHQKSLNIRRNAYSLPSKCAIGAMPNLTPSISNLPLNSTPKSAFKEVIINISDDSDSESPELDKSAVIDLNHGINNDIKHQSIEYPNTEECTDVSRRSNIPSTSASFDSNVIQDSSVPSRSSMNGSQVRTVARKSTTKNGGAVVIRREGEVKKLEYSNHLPMLKNTRRRIMYSEEENKTIIQWLIEKKAISRAVTGVVWKEIEREGILMNPPRAAANLLNYFLRSLRYKYAKYTDDKEALEKFKQLIVKKKSLK